MNSEVMGKVSFDYYRKAPSYLKIIIDMLPESMISEEKKYIVSEIYNFYLNHATEDKIKDMITISGMFKEKLFLTDHTNILKQVEYIYTNFINRIIFDSINRAKLFDIMNENIKVFVGYYELEKSSILEEKRNDLDITNFVKRRQRDF